MSRSASPQRRAAGFTLLEMMVASAIAVALIAVSLAASAELQRQGGLQSQKVLAAQAARSIKMLMGPPLSRAGGGVGNARLAGISPWSAAFGSPYALRISTRDAVYSTDLAFHAQPADPAYSVFDMSSDAVESLWLDGDTLTEVDANATQCTTPPVGSEVCLPGVLSTTLQTDLALGTAGPPVVFFANDLGTACAFDISAFTVSSRNNKVTPVLVSGVTETAAETAFCNRASGTLWARRSFAMGVLTGMSVRVNWDPATSLPTLQIDPAVNAQSATRNFQDVSSQIERIKVRQGVADLSNVNTLTWFPSDLSATPTLAAIDSCAGCAASVPGGYNAGNEVDVISALQRRVREVEITLTVRGPQHMGSLVRKDAAGKFVPDPVTGLPQDGYVRRQFASRYTLRNYNYSGTFQ